MKLRQRTLVYLVAALMVAACVSSVEAQGRRGGAQGGRGGFGQGGAGGFGGGVFGMRGGNSELQLLRRADVRKELDLLDDQIAELEDAGSGNEMRSMFQELQDVPQEERRERMQALMEEAQKKTQDKINDILLPHQATRLKQLSIQFAMQGRGGVTSSAVADELGISDEQRGELLEKSRKLREEMEKKLAEQLLKELTPAQQAKLKQLTGKPFTFEQEPPRQFGGRGGAPGAPAGGRRRGN